MSNRVKSLREVDSSKDRLESLLGFLNSSEMAEKDKKLDSKLTNRGESQPGREREWS